MDEKHSVTDILDETGKVQATIEYDEYGVIKNSEVVSTSGNIFAYTGHVFDESTGLYYAKARYYDAEIGRFVSEDSYRGEQGDPTSLNLYTYCTNNSIIYYDPTGDIKKTTATDVNYWKSKKLLWKGINKRKGKVYVTKKQLQKIYKKSGHFQAGKVTDYMVNDLNRVLKKYHITSTVQIQYFLAVCLHESLLSITEAGWCSTDYVKKYCQQYEPGTQKGRDLGNIKVGDGYRFRGAGYIQLTGRSNYQAFADAMDDQSGCDYYFIVSIVYEETGISKESTEIFVHCWIINVCKYIWNDTPEIMKKEIKFLLKQLKRHVIRMMY